MDFQRSMAKVEKVAMDSPRAIQFAMEGLYNRQQQTRPGAGAQIKNKAPRENRYRLQRSGCVQNGVFAKRRSASEIIQKIIPTSRQNIPSRNNYRNNSKFLPGQGADISG